MLLLSVGLEGIVQPTISNSSHLLSDGKYFLSRCLLNDGLGPQKQFPGRLFRFCVFPAVEAGGDAKLRVGLGTQDSMVWP